MIKTTLGIGSNQGDRFIALKTAIEKLRTHIRNTKLSAVYESPAVLLPNSPKEWDIPFLNMALTGETDLAPEELLTAIKTIEKAMGRSEHYPKWSPRIMDIDILLYGDETYQSDTLTIPHPLINEREFVLLPMSDLDFLCSPLAGEREFTSASEVNSVGGFSQHFDIPPPKRQGVLTPPQGGSGTTKRIGRFA